ncbi:hypothetical protein NCU06146 [Neurospora crassa OR74A]|uniref:Uncharacterized protein n=1 Tax=Neurospora crassa (strain ATCC 24698 / 74-OR23-1A / CBS 708.71 / DSM 1257 / FGSC 987) TaxID=367110 RepID=Q7S5E2_NEUCR|nr:hypothetical protein NCU06146 [Neurospora crassa OR74A]EAA30772.1 hypothetical protein NCU06146 [Neurospora crassa OR74A]|eukprot:XP_960008.1 hypothetical protein NCU06146 [Neurospora crassa OR74A]
MTDHNQDIDELNLPIALRRTRRTGTGTVRRTPCVSGVGRGSAIKRSLAVACTREVSPPTPPTTPRRDWKNRITKTATVRGNKTHLQLSSGAVNGLAEDELSSTGLTPMVRRTSLQPPSPAPGSSKCTYKNHNTATPSPRRSAPTKLASTQQPSTSNQADLSAEAASSHILPLRQSHHKRHHTIQTQRSASLSSTSGEEKMNHAYTEWRKREREAQEEIERLRAELKEKNETIERFHQDDETVELELPLELELDGGGIVDAERNPARSRELVEMEREKAERQTAVIRQQQQQQPRSPETPNNLTFHTALSMRQGEDLGGNGGEDGQQQYMTLDHHLRHHDPGSGSETEALSLTTSQFSEAIRARLDCSTPPPSGSRARHHRLLPKTTTAATATATAAGTTRLFPTPRTTSPMTMATTTATATARPVIPINKLTPGTQLPITPCSNSRHGARSRSTSSSSSRRTSEATTIHNLHHLHHNHNGGMNEEELEEATPTRSSNSNRGGGFPTNPEEQQQLQSAERIATLTTQNTTLQTSLSRAQSSLRVALQLVKKLEIDSDRLRGETLLLQREKRELLEAVREMRSESERGEEVLRERVRSALERRDEMWKGRMKMLGEGIVEGVRGAFEEVIQDVLMDSGVGMGMDEMPPGVELEGLPTARMSRKKRKRGRDEEEEDADEEEEVYEEMQDWEGGDGASCDLGAGNSGAGGSSGRGSYDDGLEDIERRTMRVRERMMRKRRRRTSGFGTEEEEDTDPDA